jgi:glycosyltransferase involved in cell wall biosynthesis
MSAAPAKLSVILPAYNEEALLDGCVRQLHGVLVALRVNAEIIIVNDGSHDRTKKIADKLAQDLPGIIAVHQANQGIGGAFRTGTAHATGEYLILWPADMPAEPADLAPYIEQFGRADVIVGVRRARLGYNPLMRLNAWLYPQLVGTLFGLRLRDVNWIHAYRRGLFAKITLTQRGIPMLVEALVRMRDLGATFVEVDVQMKVRLGGVASASRFQVMSHTLRGLFSFWNLWRLEHRA